MRAKLDKAVKVIISAQASEPGHEGGWRYRPIAKDADISVTVLSLVAIRAAKNGGLEVPQHTIDEGVAYVKRCQDERTGGFCYQPQRDPGFAREAFLDGRFIGHQPALATVGQRGWIQQEATFWRRSLSSASVRMSISQPVS